jgi:hypothetical protein
MLILPMFPWSHVFMSTWCVCFFGYDKDSPIFGGTISLYSLQLLAWKLSSSICLCSLGSMLSFLFTKTQMTITYFCRPFNFFYHLSPIVSMFFTPKLVVQFDFTHIQYFPYSTMNLDYSVDHGLYTSSLSRSQSRFPLMTTCLHYFTLIISL